MYLTGWTLMAVVAAVTRAERVMETYRLPENLEPTHYKLKILTNLDEDFSYHGKLWVDFIAKTSTDKITLHSKNLNIHEKESKLEELNDSISDNLKRITGGYASKIDIKRDLRYANLRRLAMRERKKPTVEEQIPKRHVAENVTEANQEISSGNSTTESPNQNNEDKKILVGILPKDPKENEPPGTEKKLNKDPVINDKFITNNSETKEIIKDSPDEEPGDRLPDPTLPEEDSSSSTTTTTTSTTTTTITEVTQQSTEKYSPTTRPTTSAPKTTEAPATSSPTTTTPVSTSTTTVSTTQYTETTSQLPTTVAGKPENNEYKVLLHDYETEKDFVNIQTDRKLVAGKKYRLYLNFQGFLTDTLTGFHRVAYSKKNSKRTTWLASTVFEPLEARTAFPCFDEPEYKATFDITLGHDKKYTALSNMPVKSTVPSEDNPEYQWDTFETTPKMSPYLVAFLVSDLEYLTPKQSQKENRANTTYRFWARHDVLQKTRYAMKIVPDMKSHIEDLVGIQDVLPKHDFVALPSFVSSALENWGLIAFAEKNILFTPGYSSIFSKYEITQILGHEIAHMWFGNLVTPKWWDQIWLSEGFANYFEVLAADHVQPTWDVKTISLVFSYLKVFSIDAMHTSHPLVPEVKYPSDLNEIFDSITYQKGYYIVRMLNYTLGEQAFMKGVREYLKSNQFSAVEEDDLWQILTKYGHEDKTLPDAYHLRDIMRAWTRETGYPVIEVARNYEDKTANVTQKRFLRPKEDYELRNTSPNSTEKETKWWIPLTYTSGSELMFENTKPKVWINPDHEVTVLDDMPDENHFILMNLQAAGLYRVNYDERNWDLLIDYLISDNYSDISVINRVQILDDLLDFARAGEISYSKALDATSYLQREDNFLPWKAALSNFEYISRMFRSTDSNRQFKKFMRNLVSPRLAELGFEPKKNESLSDGLNRKQIIKWACRTGHRQCSRKSINLFKKWTEEKRPDEHNPIPSNLRSVVYCTAIENGGAKDWQFLWQRYLNNLVVTDKAAIVHGLGCSRNTRTLKKYLEWSLKETSGIKKQDSPAVFKAVAKNDIGFNLAKDFFKERIGDIKKYMGNNQHHLPQMFDALASKMNQPSHLEELMDLEEEHFSKLRTVPRSVKQATEKVKFNIGWLEKNYKPITDWLKKQKL